jgi:hypothetical protein
MPRISLRPDERATAWLLSISTSDRAGLLYAIARVLARHGINLQLAKVSTLGERVEDTFLIDGAVLQQTAASWRSRASCWTRGAAGLSMNYTIASGRGADGWRASTPSWTCARRPSSRRTMCRAHRTGRCSATRSATSSAPCQQDPLQARLGAALVARNVARLLDERTADFPAVARAGLLLAWRPALAVAALVPGQIGFRSRQLVGAGLPRSCARAGAALQPCNGGAVRPDRQRQDPAAAGAGRAGRPGAGPGGAGRPSRLGAGAPARRGQPSQKLFDSRLWTALRGLDASRPVYVESESRKIGRVALPPALLQAMRAQGRAVWLDMDTPARVQLLLQDYAHFFADPSPSATRSTAWSSYAAAQRVLGWQRWRAKAAGPRCSRR